MEKEIKTLKSEKSRKAKQGWKHFKNKSDEESSKIETTTTTTMTATSTVFFHGPNYSHVPTGLAEESVWPKSITNWLDRPYVRTRVHFSGKNL